MDKSKLNSPLINLLVFLTSFNSFAIYAIICKYFADITGQELSTQIFLTTFFVLFLGVGSFLIEKFKGFTLFHLAKIELFLSLFFLLVPLYLNFFNFLYHAPNFTSSSWPIFALIIIAPFGLITGFELPTFIKLNEEKTGSFLLINYLGSFIASFYIVHQYQSQNDFFNFCIIIGLINFSIYFLFLLYSKAKLGPSPYISLIMIVLFVIQLPHIPELKSNLKKMSYYNFLINSWSDFKNSYVLAKNSEAIFTRTTPYQTIDIIKASAINNITSDDRWALYLNHQIQFYSNSEIIYHQTMSFFPLVMTSKIPKNILILGGGDLGLAREFSRLKKDYPHLKITNVELDTEMLNLAKKGPFLNLMNDYAIIQDDIKIVNDDAISFLRSTSEKYDIILADFPFPKSFELTKLYSKEFFILLKRHLAPKGIFVLDFPFQKSAPMSDKITTNILINTLRAAGFNKQVIFGTTDTFVLSLTNDVNINYNFNMFEKYIDDKVLTNFIDKSHEYEGQFNYTDKVMSILKPVKEFKLHGK